MRVQTPAYDAATFWGVLAGLLGLVIGLLAGACTGWYILSIVGVLVFALSYGLVWFAARLSPASVEFGDLRTFGDLANAICEEGRA